MDARHFDFRRAARAVLLGLTGAAGVATIMATSVATGPFRSTGESFLLVFAAGDRSPQHRVSRAGLDWSGVGADSMPQPIRTMLGGRGEVSVTPTKGGRWLAAFLRAKGRVGVRWADPATAQPAGPNLSPDAPSFSAAATPAITAFGDRVVLAWRSGEGLRHDLVTTAGVVSNGEIEFAEPTVFRRGALRAAGEAFNSGVSFKDGVVAGPALTHGASGEFLMLVVRETWEDVQAQNEGRTIPPRYRAAVYSSADGTDWTLHSTIDPSEFPVGPGSHVGIAGFTDSTAVAIAVNSESGQPGRVSVARYCLGPLWWELDADAVFGDVPAAGPFALLSIGEPALPGPGEYYDCVEN